MVRELYDPLEAALKGTLTGSGTLGTVLLCELLISFLCTGCKKYMPYNLLKSYQVVPMGALGTKRKIDLRPYATITENGVIYISRPTVEKMWVRLGSLPSSARATALQMLSFLEQLQAGRNTILASARAAEIVVAQFKHDPLEMNVVSSMSDFNGTTEDGCIFEVTTAEEYVTKVFVPEYLRCRRNPS